MSSCRHIGWAVGASILLAPASPAVADDGGVVGWVESTRGVPVAGAVVSIFGKGIRGGNLVTLSDSQGQFMLPALPPGYYTLRAVSSGHEPSAARHITVLPNRDSLFTLSLLPAVDKPDDASAAAAAEAEALREWRWLMRHKRRSVLETASHEQDQWRGQGALTLAPQTRTTKLELPPVAGNVELVATSQASALTLGSMALPGGVGAVHLSGRLAESVRWTLGGLVAENEGRAWRTGAQFVIEPGGGHEIEAGAGYGSGDTRLVMADGLPQPERAMGALFAKDRWHLGDRVVATAGARYTYVGFLPDSHHADAVLEVELHGDPNTVVRGSIATRSLVPGGDLLTLSSVAASPAITWARLDDRAGVSHTLRSELGVDRSLGGLHLGARVFDETCHDLLLTTFADGAPFVRNAGLAHARGFGVRLGRRFGSFFDGSVTYSFGRSHSAGALPATAPATAFADAGFREVVARVETVLDRSDTRVAALYRYTSLAEARPGERWALSPSSATRFDVQLTQGLPFLQPLTRADWELLLAVRNMFYEASEGAFLDELAVQDPPKRVVGGISVRF